MIKHKFFLPAYLVILLFVLLAIGLLTGCASNNEPRQPNPKHEAVLNQPPRSDTAVFMDTVRIILTQPK